MIDKFFFGRSNKSPRKQNQSSFWKFPQCISQISINDRKEIKARYGPQTKNEVPKDLVIVAMSNFVTETGDRKSASRFWFFSQRAHRVTEIGFLSEFPEDKDFYTLFLKWLQFSFWVVHCLRNSPISGHSQRDFAWIYNNDQNFVPVRSSLFFKPWSRLPCKHVCFWSFFALLWLFHVGFTSWLMAARMAFRKIILWDMLITSKKYHLMMWVFCLHSMLSFALFSSHPFFTYPSFRFWSLIYCNECF